MSSTNYFAAILAASGLFVSVTQVQAAVEKISPYSSDSTFFEEVDSAAGAPGTLIRYQRVLKLDDYPGELYRVLYWSTVRTISYPGDDIDHNVCHFYQWENNEWGTEYRCEKPIVTSGLVRIPKAAPPAQGFATVAFTHGTVGLIPECGPSTGYGPLWRDWMVSDRVTTVAADYPGLGYDSGLRSADALYTSEHPWYPGIGIMQSPFDETSHTYSDNWSPGASTIDLVRASKQLEVVTDASSGVSNPNFIVVGSSQGGAVAIGTAQLMSADYAPELQLKAVLAGAPGSNLGDLESADSPLAYGILSGGIVGASVSDPSLHPSEWLSPIGQANYERTTEAMCSGAGDFESYLWWVNTLYSYPFNAPLTTLGAQVEWQRYAARQDLAATPIAAPIYIGQVDDDPLVPQARTDAFAARLAPNADVTYCVYQGNGDNGVDENGDPAVTFGSMENHTTVLDRMGDEDYTAASPEPSCVSSSSTASLSAKAFLIQQGFDALSSQ